MGRSWATQTVSFPPGLVEKSSNNRGPDGCHYPLSCGAATEKSDLAYTFIPRQLDGKVVFFPRCFHGSVEEYRWFTFSQQKWFKNKRRIRKKSLTFPAISSFQTGYVELANIFVHGIYVSFRYLEKRRYICGALDQMYTWPLDEWRQPSSRKVKFWVYVSQCSASGRSFPCQNFHPCMASFSLPQHTPSAYCLDYHYTNRALSNMTAGE
jgi:hypothetical protein